MAEEHSKRQMIEHALNQTTESDDEGPLARVGRKRNVGLATPTKYALVKVHRELATITIGAKDMVAKNKNQWNTIKVT